MIWWQIDNPTPDRMIAALSTAVAAYARSIFEQEPALQTILMLVGQYWADSARDEVHDEWQYSTSAAVPWPHACDRDGAGDPFHCEFCFEWTDDGRPDQFWLPGSVDAFKRVIEAYCVEGATQHMSTAQAYSPFLVMRRASQAPEFVGQLQRPWLRPDLVQIEPPPPDLAPLFAEVYRRPDADEPRMVLADCLQAAGDPRGTFMALQLHPNPTPAMTAEMRRLEDAHRNTWLGALLNVVSPARARFTRGFASTVALGPAPSRMFEALADSPAWATVNTLAFPELDEPPTWPILAPFRQMRRIEAPEDVLEAMVDAGGDWALESLCCTGTGGIDAVVQLSLPAIIHLLLEHPRPDDLHRLAALPWWPQLVHLDLVTADPVAHFAEAARQGVASIQALLASGWLVIRRVDDTTARVYLHHYAGASFASAGDDLRAALPPDWRVEVEHGLDDATRFALVQALSTIGFD